MRLYVNLGVFFLRRKLNQVLNLLSNNRLTVY